VGECAAEDAGRGRVAGECNAQGVALPKQVSQECRRASKVVRRPRALQRADAAELSLHLIKPHPRTSLSDTGLETPVRKPGKLQRDKLYRLSCAREATAYSPCSTILRMHWGFRRYTSTATLLLRSKRAHSAKAAGRWPEHRRRSMSRTIWRH
jgi:hypothetical protein